MKGTFLPSLSHHFFPFFPVLFSGGGGSKHTRLECCAQEILGGEGGDGQGSEGVAAAAE